MHMSQLQSMLASLEAFCTSRGIAAWLVGGTVRDLLRGRVPLDIDVAVDGDGVALAREFADTVGGAFVPLDDERGTGRIVLLAATDAVAPRISIDLVQLRAPTLYEDLHLRDFTINALALPLAAETLALLATQTPPALPAALAPRMLDPCGGLRDIASAQMHPCSSESLRNDPARIMRAVRIAAETGFTFTPELDSFIRRDGALIAQVAAERVRDELLKLLQQPYASPWLRYLDDVRVLTHIFPELEPARGCDQPIVHFLPVLGHLLESVTCAEWLLAGLDASTAEVPTHACPVALQHHPALPRQLPYAEQFRAHFAQHFGSGQERAALFKLAVLLHDNAKPQTRQARPDGSVTFYEHQNRGAETAGHIAQRLRLMRQAAAYIRLVIQAHMRPGQLRSEEQVSARAIARFFRDLGEAGPDVLLHGLADHMAARGPMIDPHDWQHHLAWSGMLLDAHWGVPASEQHRQPLVNGHDLMHALNIEPGRLVGSLLHEIGEAQAAGEIHTRDEALAIARRMLAEQQ